MNEKFFSNVKIQTTIKIKIDNYGNPNRDILVELQNILLK